ncbi:MAG: TonB-dependent siderophore receptor [Pseudomonas farsensis]|uniref:TonB-dependent siderophore receptor n=1 Tax=Pseudomonas farsensis TaxID=2745492 RepID=UPI003C7B8D56
MKYPHHGLLKPAAVAFGLSFCGLGVASLPNVAHAAQASGAQYYHVPAGSMTRALSAFASASGSALSFDAALLDGLKSAGLEGNYSVAEGFAVLLQGSGLQAIPQSNGSYALRPLYKADGAVELGATTINSAALGLTTEGSGSYTTGQSASATRMALSLRETPQSVSVITRQQMDDQGLVDLAKVLQQTPGITVNRENSEGYTYYARGFEIQAFQYDGIPSLSSDGGNVRDNYSIGNSLIYDRIEVLKGATGLVNGVGYPSGVINMVRKRPTREAQGHVAAGAGSWDRYSTEVDVSGPLVDSGALRGRMVAGTEQHDSFIDYQKGEQQVFYGIVEADLNDATTLSVGYDYQKNNNDATTNAHLPVFYSDGRRVDLSRSSNPGDKWAYRNQNTHRAFVGLEHQLQNDWVVKGTVSYRKYTSREILAGLSGAHIDPVTNTIDHGFYAGGASKFNTDTDEKSVDLFAKGPFELFGRTHELVVGYNYARNSSTSKRTDGTTDASVNPFTWDNNAAYPTDWAWWSTQQIEATQKVSYAAVVLKPTDALSVILGARVNDYEWSLDSINGAGISRSYPTTNSGEVIPYAGITYDLDEQYTVYASYTDIFKPQPYNKDANDNPIEPLTGQSYELGIKGEYFDGRLNASLALFQLKQDNLAQSTGRTNSEGFEEMRAVSGATTNGVELEVAGELLADWNINAGYVYQASYDADHVRVATTQPQHLFKAATTYRLPGVLNRAIVGGNVQWQSATFFGDDSFAAAVGPQKFERGSYALVGLMASYDFDEHLKGTVNVNNLFDRVYYSGIGNYNTAYYGDPRNVMFNVKYSF